MTLNVAIVGPGRSKQGTGPFIARTFNELDTNICGVVSSSLTSAEMAAQQLFADYKIKCNAYSTLQTLLDNNKVDIVAISSPASSHLDYLKLAIESNCHIFCEKPLWWPSNYTSDSDGESITNQHIEKETSDLVRQCMNKNLILQLNTQWPYTLPTYYEIFPQQESKAQTVNSFSMWLSPQSTGSDMIIDAMPHVLSMLYSILSAGKIENIQSSHQLGTANENISINFDYLHAFNNTQVAVYLNSNDQIPKPAAYAINNNRVDRHVELSNYLISLCTADVQAPVMDPLVCSIKNFISSIHSKTSSDETVLIDGMKHLSQIYQAVTQETE